MKDTNVLFNEINSYIKVGGGGYDQWYVGVTKNPQERLFNGHSVDEASGWIYRQFRSSSDARAIESHFINRLGTAGGSGGGDHTADVVYAYRKRTYTRP